MKPTTTFFLFPLFFAFTTYSQNREVVVTRGFENAAFASDTLPGNKWAFATISSPAQGEIYHDTLTLWITDSTGRILNAITVHPPLPEERYEIYDLVSLRDTSLLLIYGGGECDVSCCQHYFIENWKPDGSFAWRINLPELTDYPFAVSSISPAELYILNGPHVFEVNTLTGQVIDTTMLSNDYPFQAAFIHGTRNIIAYYRQDSVVYYQYDTTAFNYYISASKVMTDHLYNFQASVDGDIYGIFSFDKVVRINTDLDIAVAAELPIANRGFAIAGNGVFTLTKDGNKYHINYFGQDGLPQYAYQIGHPQLEPYNIASGLQQVAIAGVYTAGGNTSSSTTSAEAWFRIYPLDSLQDDSSMYSVALIDVEQQSPVIHDSVYINEINFVGYLDNIRGGNFRMLVKNTGDQPIESFRINYHFGNNWFYWYCGLDQVKNVQYQMHLDPGETSWVEFGDVESNYMFSVPDHFCFWTSGPSDRPDDAYGDDKHCTSWYVPTLDIGKNLIDIHPNPADDVIILSGLSSLEEGVITIYSLDGKKWLEEILQQGYTDMTINTSSLPAGYYILRLGSAATPVVIQREKQ